MSPLEITGTAAQHSNYSIYEFKIHKIDSMRELLPMPMMMMMMKVVVNVRARACWPSCGNSFSKQTSNNNCSTDQVGNLLALLFSMEFNGK